MTRILKCTLTIASLAAAACGDSNSDSPDAGPNGDPLGQEIRLSDNITADTTLTADKTYIIPASKQLFVEPGATLTIQPGTVIKGERGSLIVITRGAKIMADGTPDKPIVLTTAQPDGQKTRKYWGGLLVLGAAPINVNALSNPPSMESTFEAFAPGTPGGVFGGSNAADNSGIIRYVRIEFAGFSFAENREFNNFTLCGVGSGTIVDYVQLHGGSDDGIEFFGGTVNVKHIVSSQNGDDGFDTDNGWQGKAQFIVIQHANPQTGDAANGFESDNHATAASYVATPRTMPTMYNVSLFGKPSFAAEKSFAMVLRRGTGGHYYNVLAIGFPSGIEVRDQATKAQLDDGNLFFKNSIFFGNAGGNNWATAQAMNDIDEATYFTNAAWSNRFGDPGINAAHLSLTAPNFTANPSGPAFTGAAAPPNDGFFDSSATFVGAIGTTDWTQGWTAYPQPVGE